MTAASESRQIRTGTSSGALSSALLTPLTSPSKTVAVLPTVEGAVEEAWRMQLRRGLEEWRAKLMKKELEWRQWLEMELAEFKTKLQKEELEWRQRLENELAEFKAQLHKEKREWRNGWNRSWRSGERG
ncbi:hypothetical protein BDZ91DRAFT_464226 [Kalaharituber pfeilii]|nr:hypothetical protein BDZ91DRAFT_464226 [Kalaharituber pfeilii]